MSTVPDGIPTAEEREFCSCVGHAVVAWAQIENYLAFYLCKITGIETSRGKHIFFSVSGFSSRATLLSAALRTADIPQEERDFIVAVLNKATQWSNTRNFIVHGIPTVLQTGSTRTHMTIEGGWLPSHLGTDKDPFLSGLTGPRLTQAAKTFFRLSDLLVNPSLIKHEMTATQLRELEMQVRLLPNDPLIVESTQTLAKREQQIRADLERRDKTRSK